MTVVLGCAPSVARVTWEEARGILISAGFTVGSGDVTRVVLTGYHGREV